MERIIKIFFVVVIGMILSNGSIKAMNLDSPDTEGLTTSFTYQEYKPNSVKIADINLDGNNDLIVTERGDVEDSVAIYLGLGNLEFQGPYRYLAEDLPNSAAVGDFNSDGALDIAVSHYYSDNYCIYDGYGDGSFHDKVCYDVGNGPRDIISGNLNGDDNLDLALLNQDNNNVQILLGIGDGTFQSRNTYFVGYLPKGIILNDLNNDGFLDIAAVAQDSGYVSILFSNGDGTFKSKISYYIMPGIFGIDTGDFNKDGFADLVVGSYHHNNQPLSQVTILLNDSEGGFSRIIGIDINQITPAQVTIGYFNDDDVLDLATTNYKADTISILHGRGDGTFEIGEHIDPDPYSTVGPWGIDSGDLQGKCLSDLVFTYYSAGEIDFWSPPLDPPDADFDGIYDCRDSDADGDGYTKDVDCDDLDPAINPDAEELCDGVDNNCNGKVDELGSVSGYVYDIDGNPIKGAKVVLIKNDVDTGKERICKDKTNRNGHFECTGLEEGRYFIKIKKEGYEDIKDRVRIKSCKSKQTEYYLNSME